MRLLLPRVAADARRAKPDEAGAAAPAAAPACRRARILVVDDDADVRAFLAESLDALGHQVATLECGEAALAALARRQPDLALLDFAMPGMNGAELARAARAIMPDLPIIFVTGYAESEQLEAALGGRGAGAEEAVHDRRARRRGRRGAMTGRRFRALEAAQNAS